jgi:hypothetical protein
MDPRIQIRIRIHTKMSWIRNTTFWLHVPMLCAYIPVKAPLFSGMSHSCRFRSLADPLPHPMLRAELTLANCILGKLMKKTIRLCYCPAGHQYATVSIPVCYLAYIVKL